MACSVDPHKEIRCSRQDRGSRRCRPLQISCGGCRRKLTAGPGTNLSLASPLYPLLLPGLVCRWDLEVVEVGSSSQVDLSLEVTDLSLGDETCETSTSSLHILTGAGGKEPLQSEATLCGNQNQLTPHSPGPRYDLTNKKHLQLRFVSGESERLGERRGFQLTISVSEERKSHGSLQTGLIVSILAAAVILGGLLCCVGLALNMKQAGASRMGRRPARGRQEAANIYMMDNSVARRLPTLPGFRFHSDNNLHHCDEANAELGFKLYETISLKSRMNSYENIGVRFHEYCNRVRRASIPPPPPLPERPIILSENTDMSPMYLSFSGADNEVFEE